MPLIQVAKKKKEQPYEYTRMEKVVIDEGFLPEEQVRSTNHDESLLRLMMQDEVRDASPEHTEKDIYKALADRDVKKLLTAAKNLTVPERNKIAQGIYHSILTSTKENYLFKSKDGKISVNSEKLRENAKRLELLEEESLDLFDLCVKLAAK